MTKLIVAGLFALLAWPVYAAEQNVILITFDGVRPYEFQQQQNMPWFWSTLAPQGVVFSPQATIKMEVANDALISLPAYQSIMAGFVTPCITNNCGRVGAETVAQRIRRELNLPKDKVATIASWPEIRNAFENHEGDVFTNAGEYPLVDSIEQQSADTINSEQQKNPSPWGDIRLDKYTMAHALRYLKLHQPRFLFISLNDTDNWGHDNRYDNYLAALHSYDQWLNDLMAQLKQMKGYGENTTVIISTDHSRGDGPRWTDHNADLPECRHIWLYGFSPAKRLSALGENSYSHIDLRPTIEALLGLKPTTCEKCGKVIRELL